MSICVAGRGGSWSDSPSPRLRPKPGSSSVVSPGAKLEKVWGEGEFTEGGAMAADGSILFSDIGNRILRFDPKTGKTTVFREPSGRANGMIFDSKGRLIVAEGANVGGGRRVSITDRDGTIKTLADGFDGKRFNSPNDVAVRPGWAGVCLRPALRRRRAARPRLRGGLSSSNWKGNHPRWTGRPQAQWTGHQPRRPDALRIRQRLPAAGSARRHDRRPGKGDESSRDPRIQGSRRGIDGMTVTTDGRIVAAAGGGAQGRRLHLFSRRQAPRDHPDPRRPGERRVRRRGPQDPLHLRRQEPLPDQDQHDRIRLLAARPAGRPEVARLPPDARDIDAAADDEVVADRPGRRACRSWPGRARRGR